MTTIAVDKATDRAVRYFEDKLAFEFGPYGLATAIKNKEPLQIIDLRLPELFAKSHVPSAVNVSFENLESHLPKLNKDVVTVVYCYDLLCSLAAKAALLLAQKGYRVKELAGGFDEWAKQNNQVETGAKASSCASSCG